MSGPLTHFDRYVSTFKQYFSNCEFVGLSGRTDTNELEEPDDDPPDKKLLNECTLPFILYDLRRFSRGSGCSKRPTLSSSMSDSWQDQR